MQRGIAADLNSSRSFFYFLFWGWILPFELLNKHAAQAVKGTIVPNLNKNVILVWMNVCHRGETRRNFHLALQAAIQDDRGQRCPHSGFTANLAYKGAHQGR